MLNYSFKLQRFIFVIYIISIVSLLFVRDVFEYNINKYIFAFIVILTSVIVNYQTLLSLILFTLPLMCGLPGNYFLPIWAVLILYHQISTRSINYYSLLFVAIFVIWEYVICSLYPFEFSPINYMAYSSSLLILSLLITDKSNIDYHFPVTLFCIGCCVLLSIIFVVYMRDPSLMFSEGGVRMGGDTYADEGVMTLRTNPNNIGYLSTSSIACLLSLYYYKKIKLFPFFVMLFISFACGMYSVSRTWALLVVLCFIIYFIAQKKNRLKGFLVLMTFSLAVIVYLNNNPAILNSFIERFTEDNIETAGERTTLFASYNQFLFEHPMNFFFGTSSQLYKQVTGIYYSTHNALQQIWLSYGIIGFVIFVLAFILVLKNTYKRTQYMAYLPIIIVVLFLQTIQILNPHTGMYPLVAAFMVIKMDLNPKISSSKL